MPDDSLLPDDGSVEWEEGEDLADGNGSFAVDFDGGTIASLYLIGQDYTAGDLRIQYQTRNWTAGDTVPDWSEDIFETAVGGLATLGAFVLARIEKVRIGGSVSTSLTQTKWRLAWRPNFSVPEGRVWHYMRLRWRIAVYDPDAAAEEDPPIPPIDQEPESEGGNVDLKWYPTAEELTTLLETYDDGDSLTYPSTDWVEESTPAVADPPSGSVVRVKRLRWMYPRKLEIVTAAGLERVYSTAIPRDNAPGLIPGGGNDVAAWSRPVGTLGHT